MHKPVVVIVTSNRCPACTSFKKAVLPRLSIFLNRDSRLDLKIVEMIDNDISILTRTHQDVMRFAKWLPTILVFTGISWNIQDTLSGEIFNGKLVGGTAVHHSNTGDRVLDITPTSIYQWVSDVVQRMSTHNVVIEDEDEEVVDDPTTMYTSRTEFVSAVLDEF